MPEQGKIPPLTAVGYLRTRRRGSGHAPRADKNWMGPRARYLR